MVYRKVLLTYYLQTGKYKEYAYNEGKILSTEKPLINLLISGFVKCYIMFIFWCLVRRMLAIYILLCLFYNY